MSEQTNMDWRTLDAGRELDRVVAERLGWRVEAETKGYWRNSHILVNPEGKQVRHKNHKGTLNAVHILETDPIKAWQSVQVADALPAYSTDANAALALLDSRWTAMVFTPEPDVWHCSINSISSRASDHGDGEASTPALAIVRAYLNWSDKNQ